MKDYDSTVDTLKHIKRVNELIIRFCSHLLERAVCHDESKLESPEKEAFDIETPKLKNLVYNSDEYKEGVKRLGVALGHHYKMNSHHPEHYPNGIEGMDLFDIVEMFMDWKAATERNILGNMEKSIELGKQKFGMSEQLSKIFKNTLDKMYV